MDVSAAPVEQDEAFYALRRQAVWPRRHRSVWLSVLFWTLRVYVVIMLVVVVIVLHRTTG